MKNKSLSKTALYPLLAMVFFAMAGCGPDPFYIRVAHIEGVPETGEAGTPLTLTGTVRPVFASSKDIVWSVRDAGTTGASISGNILNTAAAGIVIVRAFIANGRAEGKEYTQDFEINITENGSLPVITYYDVTFESNDGSTPTSQKVKEGGYVQRPDNPVRTGYIFADWYDNAGLTEPPYNFNSPVTGSITLYAKWNPITTHKVTFNSNGGNEIQSQTVNEGGKVSKPTDPSKSGCRFGGWYKEEALTHPWVFELDTVTGDITLYAKWTAVYTVTFNANGGNTPASQDVEEGGYARRPGDPEKTGFGFDNWYSDSELTTVYSFNTPVTGNITLHAKWVELISGIALNVTGPMKNETPDTTAAANGTVSYTVGAVSWSPNDNPFKGLTVYTAAVTVTANAGCKFAETLDAKINGHSAVITGRTDTVVTISHTFNATLAKAAVKIEIYSQPVKTEYTHGDKLDLTGLSVKLTYDDNSTEIFSLGNFGDIISEDPADGSPLSHTTHNDQTVKVSTGGHHADTNKLTVNKATPTITFPTSGTITYGMKLSQSALTGGSSIPPGAFAWQNSETIPTVTNSGYPVEFTPTDTNNYDFTGVSGLNGTKVIRTVSIIVNKAPGGTVGKPSGTFSTSTKMITVTPVTAPQGQTVEYAILTTNNGNPSTWQDGLTFTVSSAATYYIYARSKENSNYNAGAPSVSEGIKVVSQGIGFEIKPDESPEVITNTGVVISRSGDYGPETITLTVSSGYSNIKWYYNDIELGTGAELTLKASDSRYNMIGKKFVRVEASKNGVPYITNIEFEVKK